MINITSDYCQVFVSLGVSQVNEFHGGRSVS